MLVDCYLNVTDNPLGAKGSGWRLLSFVREVSREPLR